MSSVTLEQVKELVPFSSLMPSHLQELLGFCDVQLIPAGTQILNEGQYDPYSYYLLMGDVACQSGDDQCTELRSDSLFPFCDEQPRPCSVIAVSDASVVRVERDKLDQLVCWSQTAEYLLLDIAAQRDLDEDAEWMQAILKSNLFLKIPPTNIEKIFPHLISRTVMAGDVIVRQGELGDGCYFIKEGEARVDRYFESDGTRRRLAKLSPGRCFGEDALIHQTVRNATVTMITDGVLLWLEKANFLSLLRDIQVPEASWQWADYDESTPHESRTDVLIDVRSELEYSRGHLPGAINLPLNLLRLKSRLLAPHKNYRVYCNSGRRSRTAVYLLQQLGISVTAITDGLNTIQTENKARTLDTQDYLLREGQPVAGH